jgi:Sec-independent protein translocase protein TatA
MLPYKNIGKSLRAFQENLEDSSNNRPSKSPSQSSDDEDQNEAASAYDKEKGFKPNQGSSRARNEGTDKSSNKICCL